MLRERLKNYKIILGSASPRRQELLQELDFDFEVVVKKVDENYPHTLKGSDIPDYIVEQKAAAFSHLEENEIVITSDTIVWFEEKALGKPDNEREAFVMLKSLSGKKHEVITSVCFKTADNNKIIHDTTQVWFKNLSDDEIFYYINKYKPFDKAGSYGIQEWIGYIGVDRINGCFYNVMGLPIRLVYKTLNDIADR